MKMLNILVLTSHNVRSNCFQKQKIGYLVNWLNY